jgi:hypothetical protein
MIATLASPLGVTGATLAGAMRDPASYPHAVDRVEVIETHISIVFLAGEFAYKIKKPVRLPFLDFSTLDKRRFFCEEELRLNWRTAPGLYLGLVAIGGTPLVVGASPGEAVEYAVKMRRFSQDGLLDHLARAGRLEEAHAESFARSVARLHAGAPLVPGRERPGAEDAVRPAIENFAVLRDLETAPAILEVLRGLEDWTVAQGRLLAERFGSRRREGFVRECHGDLHLANAVLIDGAPVLYDCIEFDARLRGIDVMSDAAFAVMDLVRYGLPRHATRFLNAYLEETGDYAGLDVLRFYLVYRAMVRAKVACLRSHQANAGFEAYLATASRLTQRAAPVLVLMHGLSGSGKTTASTRIADALGAVRVRSDVERKRLFGLASGARTASAPGAGIYGSEQSRQTYARLAIVAREILAAGFPVVVDAASLSRAERERFRGVAMAAGAAFELATCVAPAKALESRIVERERAAADASDAGLAVLEMQRLTCDPLTDSERIHCVTLDTGSQAGWTMAAESLARRFRSH